MSRTPRVGNLYLVMERSLPPGDDLQAAAPGPPEGSQPQPWYPPAPVLPAPRLALSASTFTIIFGTAVGILLFTGLVAYHAVFLIPLPTSFPPTDPNYVAYQTTIRTLGWISIVAMDLAVSLSVVVAWIVGGLKGDVSDGMRRGVFIFASVFLAAWLILSFFAFSIFRILIRV